MSFLRSYVAPLLVVLIFLVAMLAVSARIFLPNDMMAPAPIEDVDAATPSAPSSNAAMQPLTSLTTLVHGDAGTV